MSDNTIRTISSDALPRPGGWYSQAVRHGDLIVTAGQTGVDPRTGKLAESLEAQVDQALDNLAEVIREAGASGLDAVIKTTCFLQNIEDFPVFNERYRARFGDHAPARSTMGVGLAGDILVEVEAIAVAAT